MSNYETMVMRGYLTKRDRAEAVRVARDFKYGAACIAAIKAAKTETDIERILVDARHGVYARKGA